MASGLSIASKIDVGAPPTEITGNMSARFGGGQLCDGCEFPIVPAQIEYAFEAPNTRIIRFHLGCAALWESALRSVDVTSISESENRAVRDAAA